MTLILVMGILDSTRVYRLSRAVAVDINVMDFVEAAKLRGEGSGWIIFREILPNALSPLVSELGLRFIYAVLFLSTLSFLGLGVQPPDADWGGMVKENKDGIVFGIAAALIPAARDRRAGHLGQPRRRLGPEPHHQPEGRTRLMAEAANRRPMPDRCSTSATCGSRRRSIRRARRRGRSPSSTASR